VIGVTTGRETNQRLNSVVKEFTRTIPSAKAIRRGKSSLEEMSSRLREAGVSHAVMIYLWHGGPGRLDFYAVAPNQIVRIPPSIHLNNVRLGQEYPKRVKCSASAITHSEDAREEVRRLCGTLTEALELPVRKLGDPKLVKASLHVSELPGGRIQMALTSPAGEREAGLKLSVSRLVWNQNDEGT